MLGAMEIISGGDKNIVGVARLIGCMSGEKEA